MEIKGIILLSFFGLMLTKGKQSLCIQIMCEFLQPVATVHLNDKIALKRLLSVVICSLLSQCGDEMKEWALCGPVADSELQLINKKKRGGGRRRRGGGGGG